MNQFGPAGPDPLVRHAALPVYAIVVAGLTLGIGADLLLRGPGGPGLNFFLLFAALGVAVSTLSRRVGFGLSREARVALGVGVGFAATMVLRGSDTLRGLAFFAAAVSFALPALRAGRAWLLRSGVSEQVEAVAWAGVNALAGALRLVRATLGLTAARRPAASVGPGEARGHPGRAVLRGLLLALPFLLAFGALFMAADRVFADLVTRLVNLRLDELVSHLVVSAVLSWLACGYLTGFLTGTRLLSVTDLLGTKPAVGVVEIGTALALVDLLFLAFVGVQFRYLFGGSDLVEVTPGLTYAEYVREGFGHLAMACALVLPSLLAADWILEPRRRTDALVFRLLGGLLLVLLLVIIASALQRVRVYQAAYGLTESRFYGAAFVGWLTVLTIWFAATVLRGRRERFAFPALVSGFGFIGLLLVVNPDQWIARTNLARAGVQSATNRASDAVDARYLASLGADAIPALTDGLDALPPAERCVLARGLLKRWGPDAKPEPDWRSWNWSVMRARRLVTTRTAALRTIVDSGDAASCPSSDH